MYITKAVIIKNCSCRLCGVVFEQFGYCKCDVTQGLRWFLRILITSLYILVQVVFSKQGPGDAKEDIVLSLPLIFT
jgi:hypothetical protein